MYEMGDIDKPDYEAKKADLQLQRDQLDASATPSSIAAQSGQVNTIVDDWERMTEEEKRRLLRLVFAEVRANVVEKRVELSLLVRPEWMPYLDALRVAAPDAAQVDLEAVATPERKTGLEPATLTLAR